MAFLTPSGPEWLVLAVLALIVLGPKRLPDAARSLGKGLAEMRASFSDAANFDNDDEPDPDAHDLPDYPEEDDEDVPEIIDEPARPDEAARAPDAS